MQLQNRTILMVAQYAAPYEGNFMNSLYALEECLKVEGTQVMYVLPQSAKDCDWFEQASKNHKFFLTDNNPNKAQKDLGKILLETHPDIVHTHFDGYDIPVVKVLRRLGMEGRTKVVWHLHDHLSFMPDLLRKVYQAYHYLVHYGKYGKDVAVVGVSNEVAYFANTWHSLWNKNGFRLLSIIPNAIDTSRITSRKRISEQRHSFLAFGGRNISKRIDLFADAANIINSYRGGVDKKTDNQPVNIYITNGSDTENVLNTKYNGQLPKWLHIIKQRENINELFEMADCFVSTSDAETFSYAICEATIVGLPVIQSNIIGTKWNAGNPSTFLFRKGDAEDLAKTMKRYMLTDTAKLQMACDETRTNNLERYGIEAWCDRILKFYAEL